MKNIYLIFLFIFTFSFGFSQNSITVHLNDGTTVKGSGALKRTLVKLKTSKDAKKKKIKFDKIDKILYSKKGKSTTYYFIKDDEGDIISYLQLVIDGKLNLYSQSMMNSTSYGAFESTTYYLKRDSESSVIRLGGGTVWDNFKKESAEYFKDCALIVKNISESKKGFAKKDMKEIAKFYNSECQ